MDEILKLVSPCLSMDACQSEQELEIDPVCGRIDVAGLKDGVIRLEHGEERRAADGIRRGSDDIAHNMQV